MKTSFISVNFLIYFFNGSLTCLGKTKKDRDYEH